MKKRIAKVLAGANQSEVAKILGVSAQAVTGWKSRGKIDKKYAVSLAKLRGFNPAWLITGDGPEKLDQSQKPTIENPVLLASIMDALDAFLAEKKVPLPTIKKARIIRIIYNDHVEKTNHETRAQLTAQIVDLFDLIA